MDGLEGGSVRTARSGTLRGGPGPRIAAGLGYLSEDRQGEGLALGLSIVDNLTLSHFDPFVRFGWLSLKRQRQAGWEWVRRMNIKARSPLQEVAHLSGGNQQKVALARLLHQNAEIFLMDEPTRGIDIGSKSQIYECMSGLAKEGKSVLFVSSYFPELLGVCDRIAVFHRGQLVDTRPSPGWTEESLLAAATTGRAAAEP
jgi:ribose transport system ATP-binding protein